MTRTTSALVFATLGLAALGACSSESDSAPPDFEVDAGAGSLCSSIPRATDIDRACGEGDPCGADSLCVESGGQSRCAQSCFPEECGDTCASGRVCAPLEGPGGGDYRTDVDGDGDDEVVGACVVPVPGDRGAFEACGDAGRCAEGLFCAGIPGRDGGTCFPTCTAACDVYSGFETTCAPTSADASICVIACDPALGTDACPPGLACATLAQGAAVCAR